MEYFGFKREGSVGFTYHSPGSQRERARRKNGVEEVRELSDDLKRARNGSLKGFEEFIRVSENIKSLIFLEDLRFRMVVPRHTLINAMITHVSIFPNK